MPPVSSRTKIRSTPSITSALERRGIRAAPGARAPDAGWRRPRAPCAAAAAPPRGARWPRAPTSSGRRWRPSSTASAARQAASVAAGSGSPCASIAAPPKGSSVSANSWPNSCASARRHAHGLRAVTSGPMPSPAQHRDVRFHARALVGLDLARCAREQEAELIDAVEQAVLRKRLERKAHPLPVGSVSVRAATSSVTSRPGARAASALVRLVARRPAAGRSSARCCGRCRRSRC